MQLNNEEALRQWEMIIRDVNKTDIPLECIKKVVIKLAGGKQKTINLQTLAKQGLSIEEIEAFITRNLSEMDPIVVDLDFVVDISAVARIIQPETDKLLGRL